TLAEVVGDAGDVIHVPVRDAQVVAGERELRRTADVEANIEFRNLDDRFLPRHAVSDDRVLAETELAVALGEVALDWLARPLVHGRHRMRPRTMRQGRG